MKKFFVIFVAVLIGGCESKNLNTPELKQKFGDFGSSTIKLIAADYTKAPIHKKIDHHPESYTYLNDVSIYSMAHISDGLFLTGLMVRPNRPGKYPCIVFNRGGNQELGALLISTAVEVMAPLAAKGYIVVATNYRGNGGGEGQEEFGGSDVRDVLNLINSLDEIEMADPNRVGLLGISRGGMMNYLALKEEGGNRIKTVATIGGISDLKMTIDYHPEMEEVANELIPDFGTNRTNELKSRSVNHWVEHLPSTPVLIMHSKTDQHVKYDQAEMLALQLKKLGRPYEFISFEDDTHGLANNKELVFKKLMDWFDTHLKRDTDAEK